MQNIVYGFHGVISLLNNCPDRVIKLYLDKDTKNKRVNQLLDLAKKFNLDIVYFDVKYLDKITNVDTHQGVVAEVTLIENIDLVSFLSKLSNNNSQILILDGVTDPQNLGAIIRTSSCFGVDAVIIPKNNSANINNPVVAKTSSGSLYIVPIIQVNNISQAIQVLQEYNYWVIGTTLSKDSISLYEFDCRGKLVWVLGNEGSGIRRLVTENCDYLVTIPITNKMQSLNVSVSAGIILSHVKYFKLTHS